MTNKEAHIKYDMAIQHMASNRKGSLEPEYIDLILDSATIQLIYKKINPYVSSRREGFEESLKRYTDLQVLKRTVKLEVVKGSNEDYVAILPPSSLLLIPSVEADLDVNYKRVLEPTSENAEYKLYAIEFPDSDKAIGVNQFTSFVITIDDVEIRLPSNYPTFTRNDSKFMIINYVIDAVRDLGIEIGWEKYGDLFKKNHFIFYSKTAMVITLSFDTISKVSFVAKGDYVKPVSVVNKVRVPVSIFSDKSESKGTLNKYYNTYCARSPIATIENNLLCFSKRLEYIPKYVYVTYLKKPRLYNYRINAVSEIELNDEILAMAVTQTLSITNDPTYNAQLNQSIKID